MAVCSNSVFVTPQLVCVFWAPNAPQNKSPESPKAQTKFKRPATSIVIRVPFLGLATFAGEPNPQGKKGTTRLPGSIALVDAAQGHVAEAFAANALASGGSSQNTKQTSNLPHTGPIE